MQKSSSLISKWVILFFHSVTIPLDWPLLNLPRLQVQFNPIQFDHPPHKSSSSVMKWHCLLCGRVLGWWSSVLCCCCCSPGQYWLVTKSKSNDRRVVSPVPFLSPSMYIMSLPWLLLTNCSHPVASWAWMAQYNKTEVMSRRRRRRGEIAVKS